MGRLKRTQPRRPGQTALTIATVGLLTGACADPGIEPRAPAAAPPATAAAQPSTPPSTATPSATPAIPPGAAPGRVVSAHYPAGSGGTTHMVSRGGRVMARLGGRVIAWDEQQRPLGTAEVFDHDVYLALRHDGQAFAVAGRIGPDLVVDLRTGKGLFVPFKRRWKYDTGIEQLAPSGVADAPWLGIDAYDVVLLDSALQRKALLPRSKAQNQMIEFDKKVRQLHEMDPRQGDRGGLWNLRTSSDGQVAVALSTTNQSGPARLARWNIPGRQRLSDVSLPRGLSASSFALSSNGAFAVVSGWSTAHNGTRVYRMALEPNAARGKATDLGKGPYSANLALSPDDETLLALSHDGSALWSLSTNQRLAKGDAIGEASSAVITSAHIIVNSKGGISLLDRRSLAPRGLLGAPGRGIRKVRRLDDGSIAMATDLHDSKLVRWSPNEPERLVTLGRAPWHFGTRGAQLVGLVGRGKCATAELLDKATRGSTKSPLWKVCTSEDLHVGRFGRSPRVEAVDFERGRVALHDGSVYIYDATTDQRTNLAGGGTFESLRLAAFSPGGRYFYAVTEPKSIVPERVGVWDVSTGKLLHRLEVNDEFAGFSAVSRDERRLMASWGEKAHLFDLTTGRPIKTSPLPSFTTWLLLDTTHDEFVRHSRIGRQRFDTDLTALREWKGWRMQPIEDGARLAFFASGEQPLATLELTKDGHVVYTPAGRYAASGSPPDHLYWVEPQTGQATRLTRMPGTNDPAAIRQALRLR